MPRPLVASTAMTPREILAVFRRHIWLIISLTISGIVIGGVSWFLLSRYYPRYTAQTLLRVLPAVEKDPMTIPSAQVQKDIQYGARLSLATLIKQQSTLVQLVSRDKIQATKWFQSFGEIKDRRIMRAVRNLEDYFGAAAQRESEYIVLSMTCGSREESALIVNEMVDLFLSLRGSTKKEEVAARLTGLEDQRVRVQRDLDAAERSLDDVRKRWGFTDLGEHNWQDTITLKLKDLETQQNNLIMEIREVQTNIEVLRRQATGPIDEQVESIVETDPTMVMLTQQIALQESQLAGLLAKFGENHKVIRQTQEFIAETKLKRQMRQNEIAEQTRRANLANGIDQLVVLQARLEELEKLRRATEAKNRDLDLARTQYSQRESIRDERRDMLDSVKGQIEKLKILHDDPETVKVQRVGYAPEPLEMSFPKIIVFLPVGMMLGLMSGIGLAFLIELLNDMVRTPKDVARYLRIPLLGIIPETADDPMIDDRDIDLCRIIRQAPYSVSGEAYRQFRTNLKLSSNGALNKVLLISSCYAGDGKTVVATNLATTLAGENKKVLVIDTNLWQPGLHKAFPRPSIDGQIAPNSELGLNHLLRGQCDANDVIRQCDVEGLSIIDAGRLSSKPAHLLASQRMEELLKQQRDNYDYIIIDGLPVLLVSESKILARLVDGTILVFNAATTRRGAAQRAIRELKDVDANVLGCVIFGARILKGGYFHEQFKSYQRYHKPLLVNPT